MNGDPPTSAESPAPGDECPGCGMSVLVCDAENPTCTAQPVPGRGVDELDALIHEATKDPVVAAAFEAAEHRRIAQREAKDD